ncbi:protein IQ-DOMAIN 1-like isoform X2 [Phoenix dactylifera]|uniref:Protein IQ-DOMAIN 1-like isoform X2 n=1 Tax=Phoenix dactylifera TaxID=42345 RepID=A0A8B7BS61_PHODC|nr:protein IQ-DOMAIN 1-like isoform X2 [Phoenix dactylifera]
MGSGDWFKTIICRKKTKQDQSKQVKGTSCQQSNGFKWRNQSHRKSKKLYNGCGSMSIEDLAAIQIQTAFRGFRARKNLCSLKGTERLQVLAQGHSVKKQTSSTLSYIQSWSKIQAQIGARRICMVTEGHIRQKKQDNQLKLEAKIHDLEVEWCGGSETMEEILARIQQREEAAIKRERAMAYAFSHQWRANPGLNQGPFVYECGKGNWRWSWMDRWIAGRPWETRLPTVIPKQAQTKATSKVGKNTNPSAETASDSVKPAATDGKGSTKRSSQSNDGKMVSREQIAKAATSHQKTKNPKMKEEQQLPTQTSDITA